MWVPLDNDCAVEDENFSHSSYINTNENNENDDENTNDLVLPREEVRESLNQREDEDTDDAVDAEDYDYDTMTQCSCKSFWNSRYGRVVIYIFLTLLLFASLTTFVLVIQLIVVPYNKASIFQATNCTVIGVTRLFIDSHCTCTSKGCDARYMCLSVHVQFPDEWGILHNASVAENEVLLGDNCSYFPTCKASHTENVQQTKEYEDAYGQPQQIYPCLYNPIDHKQVIRTQRFSLHHVIHGLIWTLAFLMTTILILVYVLVKMKYIYYYK